MLTTPHPKLIFLLLPPHPIYFKTKYTNNTRLFLGDGAPLSSVFAALRTMGSAYVPCVLLVLSGSLAQVRNQRVKKEGEMDKNERGTIFSCLFYVG